jgi:hypothetical protein
VQDEPRGAGAGAPGSLDESEPASSAASSADEEHEAGFAGRQRDRFVGMAGSARDEIAEKMEQTDPLEIVAAILLALATISSAWSAYQATRWTGVQATEFGRASSLRQESVRESNQGNVQVQIDVGLYTEFLNAYVTGETDLAEFYRNQFRPEFKPAFEAWFGEITIGSPPSDTPFQRPEYQVGALVEAERLAEEATAAFEAAKEANQLSDNFVLTAVLFASVLFFAGVGTRFRTAGIRRLMIGLAGVMFIGAVIVVFSLPQNIGF